jgi:hypothetical protein
LQRKQELEAGSGQPALGMGGDGWLQDPRKEQKGRVCSFVGGVNSFSFLDFFSFTYDTE